MQEIMVKDGIIYREYKYKKERELQNFIFKHWEYIFGKDTLFFKGERIGVPSTARGAKGIPDGFVLDVAQKKWYVIEVELYDHDPYDHVIPQITKFSQAWKNQSTQKKLKDSFVENIRGDSLFSRKLHECGISNDFEFISHLLEQKPNIAIIVDRLSDVLVEACESLTFNKIFIPFETYQRDGVTELVPIFHTQQIEKISDAIRADKHVNAPKTASVGRKRSREGKLSYLGKTINITSCKQIIVSVAEELIARSKLKIDMLPWGPGGERYYINIKPIHKSGIKFFSPYQLPNGWWIETNASCNYSITLAKQLIKRCGLSDTVIEFDEQ